MIRSTVLTLFAGLALAAQAQTQAQAQDKVYHLYELESGEAKADFLSKLRQKGYIDFAKEFTDQLIKNATPEELPILKLEHARTTVAFAKRAPLQERAQLMADARAAFEPFVKANPDSLAGAQARIEMAKLLALQGVMRLNKANSEKDDKDRAAGSKEARDLYDRADGEFAAAFTTLEGLKKTKEATNVEFDRALYLIDKAATYNTEIFAENKARGETVLAAKDIFMKFAIDPTTEKGLLANAFLVKCYQEIQDPQKANEHLQIVRLARGPYALPAQKQAVYYEILYFKLGEGFRNEKYGNDPLKATAAEVDLWVKAFPFAKNTFEGGHLRFEQAVSYLNLAGKATDGFKKEKWLKLTDKEKVPVITYLGNADKIAKELEDGRGDFSERGSNIKAFVLDVEIDLGINRTVAIDPKNPKLPKGTTDKESFAMAFAKAERKFQEAARETKAPSKVKLFGEGQALLSKAITIGTDENVTPTKLHDAQFLLGAAYDAINDRHRAAISFESLARANPPSKKSAEAAAYAINFYKRFVDEERDDSARYFMRNLGEFILGPERATLWKGDPVIGLTRYQLALDHFAEKEYKEAFEQMTKVPTDFPQYVQAHATAILFALSAAEADTTPEGKKAWTKTAREAIAKLGPLPANADGTTALRWFLAMTREPNILYTEAVYLIREGKEKEAAERYGLMAKSIANLDAAFKKDGGKLAKEHHENVKFTIKVLDKYNHLGAAEIEYRKGNYKRVTEDDMLGGTVRELLSDWAKDKSKPLEVVDVRVAGETLSLVLRSYIQMENIKTAKGVYDVMTKIKPKGNETFDNTNFTRSLIQDLEKQIEDMTAKGDTAKLKSMVGNFTKFGDALADTLVYGNKKRELRDVEVLIRFFRSLGEYERAAKLVETVPAPAFLNKKGFKGDDKTERELAIYWHFQLEKANLLRAQATVLFNQAAGKKTKELEAANKAYEGANKAYNSIITHENTRMGTLAKIEQIRIYEEKKEFGAAIKLWSEFMKDLQRAGIGQNKKLQELYFDAYYYNTVCFHKLSQRPDVKADKAELYIKQSAGLIARLENSKDHLGWDLVGPKFVEYMSRERTLKTAYENAKKALK